MVPATGDVRILALKLCKDFIPKDHAILQRVRLGRTDQFAARATPGQLKSIAQHPLHARAGKDGRLHGDLIVRALVHAPPYAAVLPFGVLANADEIDLFWALAAQRAGNAPQQFDRA